MARVLQLGGLALDAAFYALDRLDSRVQLAALDRRDHCLKHRDQLTLVADGDRALVGRWRNSLVARIR